MEFWTYFALPNSRKAGSQNLYPNCHTPVCLAAHHVEKFREVTPTGPRVSLSYYG